MEGERQQRKQNEGDYEKADAEGEIHHQRIALTVYLHCLHCFSTRFTKRFIQNNANTHKQKMQCLMYMQFHHKAG